MQMNICIKNGTFYSDEKAVTFIETPYVNATGIPCSLSISSEMTKIGTKKWNLAAAETSQANKP